MKKILDFARKFWIGIVVLVCVTFVAIVYTYGAIFNSLLSRESAAPVLIETKVSESVVNEVPELLSESKPVVNHEINPSLNKLAFFNVGGNVVTVEGIIPKDFNLLSHQQNPDGEWLQLFVTDNSVTTLEDGSAKSESFHIGFYIEETEGRCHLNFCNLPIMEVIRTQNMTWQYRGAGSYSDAGYNSKYPNVYTATIGKYTIYADSKEHLPESQKLKNFFETLSIEIE